MSNEHEDRTHRLKQLDAAIDAQDEAMNAVRAHAAELSAQGVELPAGPLLAELDAVIEKAITSARTNPTTVHYGLRA